ncbi:MAG: TIGR03790 family protein [Anaerolineaceae bacterium]|nr:TIGR03790 family protein [Anaerolineaceae bacterium]
MRRLFPFVATAVITVIMVATFAGPVEAAVEVGLGPENIVILVNDRVPASVELGSYYAAQRGVPTENILHLKTGQGELITRDDFDKQIVAPLRDFLNKRLGRMRVRLPEGELVLRMSKKQIRCLVPVYGVPVKIDGFKSVKNMYKSMAAGVDSELTLLPKGGHLLGGAIQSPYFAEDRPFNEGLARHMLLVCRLDGPSPKIVRRMIDDALWAEEHGLQGRAYFDVRNINKGGYAQGDKWIRDAYQKTKAAGIPSYLDQKAEVMSIGQSMPEACFYLGWYMPNVSGAIARPQFRFQRGAVAYHLHSFSAMKLRTTKERWAGPLLARGAACTMGAVYEPYLTGTPYLDIFTDRLLKGYTFAESAYMSQRLLSWMMVFLGDPLYRPFAKPFRQPEGDAGGAKKEPPAPKKSDTDGSSSKR